ncbi:MAG: 50S ribosomal protein L29 [Pseudomonadota bacterium]
MADKGPKMIEIRDRSDEELKTSLARAQDELFRFKLGRFTNQLQNVMQIRNRKREIARIQTVLSARRAGREAPGQGTMLEDRAAQTKDQ